jgi:aldehyde dehydrogenase (NAD+)
MRPVNAQRIHEIFAALGAPLLESPEGLSVQTPITGEPLATLARDTPTSVEQKIRQAEAAQARWAQVPYATREAFLKALAAETGKQEGLLAELITAEGGKIPAEGEGEVKNVGATITKTMKDAEDKGTETQPAGVVGLITSYNFPLSVAGWTLAPALLAGNSVAWKPSEKTPLTALAFLSVFNEAAANFNRGQGGEVIPQGLLQVLVGERDIGQALVASEQVSMVSATGSVGMGDGIKATLAGKTNQGLPPILELGGNNGVIISARNDDQHLDRAVSSILHSYFGTGGQRCTNTRRLIVHEDVYDRVMQLLKAKVDAFTVSGQIKEPVADQPNAYGYGPLIDAGAFHGMSAAMERARAEGGTIHGGARLMGDRYPHAYYVAPAIAEMPAQTPIMHHETFAPLLFVTKYKGGIEEGIRLVNEPDNAGLVNGLYSQSRLEQQTFAEANEARHSVINSPRGTGTPAHGLGFGGNKKSGEGKILSPDPLAPFSTSARASQEVPETPHVTEGAVEKWVRYLNTRGKERVVVNFTDVPSH